MDVVVWNLSHWQKTPAQREKAWQAVGELGQVALLQETVPPPSAQNCVYAPIGGTRPWGSVVLGFGVEVKPVLDAKGRYNSAAVPLPTGNVAVATVGAGASALTFVSVYGMIENGYADTTVNEQLSKLVPLFDSPKHEKRLILGGDLNITTQWIGPQLRYLRWEHATLQRIESFGLRDCLDAHREPGPLAGCGCSFDEGCRHVRTQYHPRSKRPWQNDYVFASAALMPRIKSAKPIDRPDLRKLSDHLPIVVTLDA